MTVTDFKPLGDYARVLAHLRKTLATKPTVRQPFAGSQELSAFRDIVKRGRDLLPDRYHATYVDILDSAVRQAEKSLVSATPAHQARVFKQLDTVFATFAAPLVQLDSSEHASNLKGFHALVSNLYRRFMDDDKIQSQARKLMKAPELDPLGFFVPGTGPYALTASTDMPVALVAKPANHAGFLPLWIVDGHEVGGHIIQSTIGALGPELVSKVGDEIRAAFAADKFTMSRQSIKMPGRSGLFSRKFRYMKVSPFMTGLWSAWTPELAADAAGVLNMGPMFVDGLICLLAQVSTGGKLTGTTQYPQSDGFGSHPVDLVRVLFAIELLERLSFTDKTTYVAALRKRAELAAGGKFPENISWLDGSGVSVVSVPIADMKAIMSTVIDTIADTSLSSLQDRSMRTLMHWGSKDEEMTREISANLLASIKSGKVTDPKEAFEARHVIAASVLALEKASLSGSSENFTDKARKIHDSGITLLKSLYEEQCLLCSITSYGPTRRKDVSLYKLASLVSSLRAKNPGD